MQPVTTSGIPHRIMATRRRKVTPFIYWSSRLIGLIFPFTDNWLSIFYYARSIKKNVCGAVARPIQHIVQYAFFAFRDLAGNATVRPRYRNPLMRNTGSRQPSGPNQGVAWYPPRFPRYSP